MTTDHLRALRPEIRARDGESGATVVEFALIAVLLFTLLFGIIEFGFVLNDQLEIRSLAREGARLAAVDNGCSGPGTTCGTNTAQRDAIIAAIRAKQSGLANSSQIKVDISDTGNAVGTDSVTVCLNYTVKSITGFFNPIISNKVLHSKAVFRLEQTPTWATGTDSGGPGDAVC